MPIIYWLKIRHIYCKATLGKETDTDDIEGNIISECHNFSFSKKDIEQVLLSFEGDIMQTPPIYSAIRYKGKRLYEWAREGTYIKPKARQVTIYDIELLQFSSPDSFLFKVECSKGTYIRSLCRDIGQKLGCGAYMSFLLRTQTGIFSIDNSFTLDEIKHYHDRGKIDKIFTSIDEALADLDYVIVDDGQFERLINGSPIQIKHIKNSSFFMATELTMNDYFKIYCKNKFIGIGFLQINGYNDYLKIKRLLI